MKLDVHSAEISTAAVSIKTLTVSGKQVTLAVFRQLQNEDLILPGPSLAGVPWGTVNYFPPPCDPDHLHVVWQKGAELRRSCVITGYFPDDHKRIARERLMDLGDVLLLYEALNKPDVCREGIRIRTESNDPPQYWLEREYPSPVGKIEASIFTATAARLVTLQRELADVKTDPAHASYVSRLSNQLLEQMKTDRGMSWEKWMELGDEKRERLRSDYKKRAIELAPKLCEQEFDEAKRQVIEEHGEVGPEAVSQWLDELEAIRREQKEYMGLVAVLRSLPQLFIAV